MSDIPPVPLTEPPATAQPAPVTPPPATGQPSPPPAPEPPAQEPQPPAETDWKAEARKWEQRAKANSDAAARLQEIEDAQKTDAQRTTEALAQAQAEAAAANADAARLRAAMAKAPAGTDPATIADLASRLRGSTAEELEADAASLFARIAPPPASQPAAQPAGTPVEALRPGSMPVTPSTPLAEQIAAAEAAGDRTRAMGLKAQQLYELQKKQATT